MFRLFCTEINPSYLYWVMTSYKPQATQQSRPSRYDDEKIICSLYGVYYVILDIGSCHPAIECAHVNDVSWMHSHVHHFCAYLKLVADSLIFHKVKNIVKRSNSSCTSSFSSKCVQFFSFDVHRIWKRSIVKIDL